MRGFAFVQFKTVAGAARAINALNLKEIKGQRDIFLLSSKHCSMLAILKRLLKC